MFGDDREFFELWLKKMYKIAPVFFKTDPSSTRVATLTTVADHALPLLRTSSIFSGICSGQTATRFRHFFRQRGNY